MQSAPQREIDLKEAVSLLGVSSATVRNWIRHDYLVPTTQGRKVLFDYQQVRDLKEKIANGELGRLNKRANKKHAQGMFIPEEYADSEEMLHFVQYVLDEFHSRELDKHALLYALVFNAVKAAGLKSKSLKQELNWWKERTKNTFSETEYSDLLKYKLPKTGDFLGLIYQSLSLEGKKAQGGSYYTPRWVVEDIVQEYVQPSGIVLDPCCGTGQFLLSAATAVKHPSQLWGFDIDETAVKIARINLLIKFADTDFEPNIFLKDTLFSDSEALPEFDVVMTNPPWGVHFSPSEIVQIQENYPHISSDEAFSLFISKGRDMLKDGGVLAYILPEAILHVKIHRDVRNLILHQTEIARVKHLNRVFKKVFTPVIRLDVRKKMPSENSEFEVENGTVHKVLQARLKSNPDFTFDVFNGNNELAIIDKFFAVKHTSLAGQSEWALGVVTGDNKKYLLPKKEAGSEAILTGKEIKRYLFNSPKHFIKFEPDKFQQVAPVGKYRAAEKLIYKFISKDLVFAYDDKQTLTLNSANILIPKVPNYPIKTVLALFNSSLYQFVYQKKFRSIKILRSDVEKLPLPLISESQHKIIAKMLEVLLRKETPAQERAEMHNKLDCSIMELFNLTKGEQEFVRQGIKSSEKLLTYE